MVIAPHPANEQQRLSDLLEYDIMDSLPEKEYDDITKIAAEICNASGSLIGLIDERRQWFLSKVGLEGTETERDFTFCSHAILNPTEMMVVPDSSKDERFFDHPSVLGEPYVGFYAGVPLINSAGSALGTLCVIDKEPREITEEQKQTLLALARQVVAYMDIRRLNIMLQKQKEDLQQINKELERFSYVVAHDIKSPCGSLVMASDYLKEIDGPNLSEMGREMLDMMTDAAHGVVKMVDGILTHTKTVNASEVVKTGFTFSSIVEELKPLLPWPNEFTLKVHGGDLQLFTSRYILIQVLLNLCTNAIKYNDRVDGILDIAAEDKGGYYEFKVADNGRGIKPGDQQRIFDLFSTLDSKDRNNEKGYGIGLATVLRLVHKMNGDIGVESAAGNGSTFTFTFSK